MNSLTFLREGQSVALVLDGRRVIELGWKASLDALRELDIQLRFAERGIVAPEGRVSFGGVDLAFRLEQDKILVIGGGRLLFDAPTVPGEPGVASIARLIWARWKQVTKETEEIAAAEAVAHDAAILCLSGAPIGLSSNPQILSEAAKLAEGDRDLRRYMGNAKRRGMPLPAPTLRTDVSPFERAQKLIRHLSPEKAAQFRSALN